MFLHVLLHGRYIFLPWINRKYPIFIVRHTIDDLIECQTPSIPFPLFACKVVSDERSLISWGSYIVLLNAATLHTRPVDAAINSQDSITVRLLTLIDAMPDNAMGAIVCIYLHYSTISSGCKDTPISSQSTISGAKITILRFLPNQRCDVIDWIIFDDAFVRLVSSGIPHTHPSIPTTVPMYLQIPPPKSSLTLKIASPYCLDPTS